MSYVDYFTQHYTFTNEKGEVELSYEQKIDDRHRNGWLAGDWTDDTDQMILIMDSIVDKNGEVCKFRVLIAKHNW